MNELSIVALLGLAPPPPAGTEANPTGQMIIQLGMFAILGLMFYMMLIRPQQKKAKDHATLLNTLKSGDRVVTSGGVVGIVVSVKDKTVSLRSADTKLEVLKSAVTEVTERGAGSSSES